MAKGKETIADLLRDEGIRTKADLHVWYHRYRDRVLGESLYNTLVRKFGKPNADAILRVLEVRSW